MQERRTEHEKTVNAWTVIGAELTHSKEWAAALTGWRDVGPLQFDHWVTCMPAYCSSSRCTTIKCPWGCNRAEPIVRVWAGTCHVACLACSHWPYSHCHGGTITIQPHACCHNMVHQQSSDDNAAKYVAVCQCLSGRCCTQAGQATEYLPSQSSIVTLFMPRVSSSSHCINHPVCHDSVTLRAT